MKFAFKLVSLVIIPLYLSGCMTLFNFHKYEKEISFDSNVEGVDVVCENEKIATPGKIALRQSKNHVCTAEKNGYVKRTFKIQSGISSSGFGSSTATNLGAWGWYTFGVGLLIGWAVDAVSGAMKEFKTDSFYIMMEPSPDAPPPPLPHAREEIRRPGR
jgi:hypothetical protein